MIPNKELIQAVLDGKTVQRGDAGGGWHDFENARQAIGVMVQNPQDPFRLKPVPIVRWQPVFKQAKVLGSTFIRREVAVASLWGHEPAWQIRRIELDPETLEVISSKDETP